MKRKIKDWIELNGVCFKKEEQEAVEKIKDFDAKDDLGNLSLSEVQLREKEITRFWEFTRKQEVALFHKTRFRWVKAGDENLRYFHSIIN